MRMWLVLSTFCVTRYPPPKINASNACCLVTACYKIRNKLTLLTSKILSRNCFFCFMKGKSLIFWKGEVKGKSNSLFKGAFLYLTAY